MELFSTNLRSNIHIISIESVYPNHINTYLKNIETIWDTLKDKEEYQTKKLFFISHQKPISITECSNSDLMEEFSYLLHHYIQIFYEIQLLFSNNPTHNNKQKYYILSGCCLSSFKNVFAKVIHSNKWMSKNTHLTNFCHNLDYVIQYFKPDKHIYDFNTKNSILGLDDSTQNLNNINTLTKKKHNTSINNNEEPVSILIKVFKYLNEWMDNEKRNKDVLCLDGMIFNITSNQKNYLLGILDFLFDK